MKSYWLDIEPESIRANSFTFLASNCVPFLFKTKNINGFWCSCQRELKIRFMHCDYFQRTGVMFVKFKPNMFTTAMGKDHFFRQMILFFPIVMCLILFFSRSVNSLSLSWSPFVSRFYRSVFFWIAIRCHHSSSMKRLIIALRTMWALILLSLSLPSPRSLFIFVL